MNPVTRAIAAELYFLRQEHKLTQTQLQEKTGIMLHSISRYENGVSEPRISTLVRILHPLGETLGSFLERSRIRAIESELVG